VSCREAGRLQLQTPWVLYEPDPNSFGGTALDPAFVLLNDQAVVAWDSELRSQQYSTVVVQTNTATAGWAPIGPPLGQIPQYSHGPLSAPEAYNPLLATDGTTLYATVITFQADAANGLQGQGLRLLKKVGN
jgi:hypothetical protein